MSENKIKTNLKSKTKVKHDRWLRLHLDEWKSFAEIARQERVSEGAVRAGIKAAYELDKKIPYDREEARSCQRKYSCPDHERNCPKDCLFMIDWMKRFNKRWKNLPYNMVQLPPDRLIVKDDSGIHAFVVPVRKPIPKDFYEGDWGPPPKPPPYVDEHLSRKEVAYLPENVQDFARCFRTCYPGKCHFPDCKNPDLKRYLQSRGKEF